MVYSIGLTRVGPKAVHAHLGRYRNKVAGIQGQGFTLKGALCA